MSGAAADTFTHLHIAGTAATTGVIVAGLGFWLLAGRFRVLDPPRPREQPSANPPGRLRRAVGLLIAMAISATGLSACAGDASSRSLPLRLVRDVPLPGDASRFDYQDVDPGRRRLFVAHLGASRMEVIDLDSLTVLRSVTGLSMIHGVRVAPSLGRVYVSATGTNQVVTLDEDTLTEINRAPTGDYPDGIAVDADHQRAFVSNEHGGGETVIDANDGARVGTVDLGGDAGNVAVDSGAGRVLVDVQSRNELVSIDPTSLAILSRTRLRGCDNSHGLYVDTQARLAFVACDADNRLLVVDLGTMKTLSRFGLGDGPDVLAFDSGLGRLYVAAESGTVSVFSVKERTVQRLAQAPLEASAHSVAVDPTTHWVYFPLQSVGGHPVLRVMAPSAPGGHG